MRLDIFVKKNILLLLKSCRHFSPLEKRSFLKLPRSFWQKEIILGNIKFQKKIVKPSYNIDITNLSSVNIAWKNIKNNWNIFFREHLLSYPSSLTIILVKPGFLVINKPVGMSAHPVFPLNQKLPRNTTLIETLTAYYPEAVLVHRLDKETSGIILVARNNKTKNYFKKQFKNHQVKKEYFALVEGDFPYNTFEISSLIGKRVNNPIKRGASNLMIKVGTNNNVLLPKEVKIINPKNSLTIGERVASGTINELAKKRKPINKLVGFWKKYLKPDKKRFTVLKLTPKTGRTHQLRVHLNTAGFPIVGDKLYGGSRYRDLPFHCLHAFSLRWLDHNSTPCSAKTPEIIVFQ